MKKKRLPSRRSGYNLKVKVGDLTIHIRTGEYKDGSLGEIKISCGKIGEPAAALMNALCIAVSTGLQYGIPLEEFVKHYKHARFEPAGMVVGHDKIKMCASILDLIFKDLENNYLRSSTETSDVKK